MGDPQSPSTGTGAAEPLVGEAAAERIQRYGRMLVGLGVGAGAMAVLGAVRLLEAVRAGDRLDWLIGFGALALALVNGLTAGVRYRQLARFLRCGSGSKFEDLVKAAETPDDIPES